VVEFSKREELERWLEGKPREWAVVIAARAALRVVPLLATVFGPRGGELEKAGRDIILPVFRGVAASWVAGTWPSYGTDLDAYAAYTTSALETRSYPPAAAEATAAADAAYATAAADTALRTEAACAAAEYAAKAEAWAGMLNDNVRKADDRGAGVWAAISADATALEAEGGFKELPTDLAIKELWPTGIPTWAKRNWTKLRSALLKANEDWDVWTDWYEARLYGISAGFLPKASLEIARVTIEEKVWEQGPKVVNAHIKRLMEEHEKREEREIFQGLIADENIIDADADNDNLAPSIPAPRRAAVEPVWRNGKLTVPTQPIAVDLQQNEFPAALRALRAGLQKFANDLDGEANIDRRFVAYLRHLAEQIPEGVPPQHELFELGHAEEVFIKYSASVNEQWPDFLAARFHAMVRQHDNTMRQAPAWRDFKRNALRDTITQQQVAEVVPIAAQITSALRNDEARPFIGAPLPKALDTLAEPLRRPPPDDAPEEWRHAIEAGNELLALDVIESINNTLKRIAEVAVATGATLGKAAGTFGGKFQDGLLEGAAEEGQKYGKRMVKWLCAGGVAGASIGLQQLILTYPHAFGWLGSVIEFLSRLHLP
jgi:hypothetical protein